MAIAANRTDLNITTKYIINELFTLCGEGKKQCSLSTKATRRYLLLAGERNGVIGIERPGE